LRVLAAVAGAVTGEETIFDKIVCDLGVNFEFANSTDFCPVDFVMFKAVSTTCFLLMKFDKKSMSFEKFQSCRLGISAYIRILQ